MTCWSASAEIRTKLSPRLKLPGMTVDQTINLWATIGTWLAAAGTVAAATIALWLARRAEKVKLKTWVGRRFIAPSSSPKEFISFEVTNCGERPVTITALVFRVGRYPRRRRRQVGLLPAGGWKPQDLPHKIEHAESALFRMDFATWVVAMREDVLRDIPEKDWKTIRALIVTSVGHDEVVYVDRDALERLRPEADTA